MDKKEIVKDSKEREALSKLCEEQGVKMIRALLPPEVMKSRKNCKSGISQFKGSLWAFRQVRNRVEYYRKRAEEKTGWNALLKYLDIMIADCVDRKSQLQHRLDNALATKHHSLDPDTLKSQAPGNTIGKMESNAVKPKPINKQTMEVIDYQKGDMYQK